MKEAIKKMMSDLKAVPRIELPQFTEGVDIDDNEAVFLKADVLDHFKEFNEKDRDLTLIPDETKLLWEVAGQQPLSGEISLTNPAIALNTNLLKANPAITNIDYTVYRYFDDHPFSGDGWVTVYQIGNSLSAAKVFLFNNDKLYGLDIDLYTYLQMLTLSKGFYNWQFLFLEQQHVQMARGIKDELNASLNALEALFPGTTAPLKRRLEMLG